MGLKIMNDMSHRFRSCSHGPITSADVDKICAMWRARLALSTIAKSVGCGKQRVSDIVEEMIMLGVLERNRRNWRLRKDFDSLAPTPKLENSRLDNMRAGVWHLIDLKRAGHSRFKTEYNIPPGDNVRAHYSQIEPRSYAGSSALACSEN